MTQARDKLIHQVLAQFRSTFQGVKSGIRMPDETFDLTGAELSCMMEIGQSSPEVSVKFLATQLGISSGAVTQVVDKLAEKGLVDRVEDNNDRRISHILLSKKANGIHDAIKQQFHARFQTLFQNLTDQELEHFCLLLQKITPSKRETE